MSVEMAWRARREGCAGCCFFLRSVTVSGQQAWGTCQYDRPRASSNATWPIVKDTSFCASFLPAPEVVH